MPRVEFSLSAMSMPPLPADLPLPPLPRITDVETHRVVLTHGSMLQSSKKSGLTGVASEKIYDYEKVEHVGDAILGVIVTNLLHDLFPRLREGPATILKGLLICNATLAQLADRYGITRNIIAAPTSYKVAQGLVKTRGSLFESWIAGVWYSFLEQDIHEVWEDTAGESDEKTGEASDPSTGAQAEASDASVNEPAQLAGNDTADEPAVEPKDLSSLEKEESVVVESTLKVSGLEEVKPTSSAEPDATPTVSSRVSRKTRGQAYDYLETWLRPLFTPIAHYALAEMQKEQTRIDGMAPPPPEAAFEIPEEWGAEDRQAVGASALLHDYAQRTLKSMPFYEGEVARGGLWKVKCVLFARDGRKWKNEATRLTKKDAKSVAAWKVQKAIDLEEVV